MLPTIWDTIPAAGDSRECFADEVAIDFPSVDRCRRAPARRVSRREARAETTGALETPETLTTEVSLSRRDATMGTVVPLDVPVRGTCAPCGGRGEIWTEPCPECSRAAATASCGIRSASRCRRAWPTARVSAFV